MKDARHILVDRYEYWDVGSNQIRKSDTFATIDAILGGHATPLPETARLVRNSDFIRELISVLPGPNRG